MRPKLTYRLLIRTAVCLLFLLWAAWSVFRVPGGTFGMRAAMGSVFAILLAETVLPLLRAFPAVSEKADFLLAAAQYVGVPALGFLLLLGAVGRLYFAGALDTRTMLKAEAVGAALCGMGIPFVGRSWKHYRRERRKTRQERLAELDRAYRQGAISRQTYQERREAVYETMWKTEDRRMD